ncbi:MAG TPA: SH3 domain-containing protein [Desulfotignum sp.]|jgi:SH3-like domain-containing protein|nr:SH3 domain-containing protein [Desulfotignum sp.]
MSKKRPGYQAICLWMSFVMALGAVLLGAGVAAAAERLTVKASIANMRSGPTTSHDVLWQVEKYHPFLVEEKRDSWVKVKDFEGDMAWIHESLLTNVEGVITNKPKCNVRSDPTTESSILFTVERGVPFRVIKRQGDWIHIEHADGEKGWIFHTLVW